MQTVSQLVESVQRQDLGAVAQSLAGPLTLVQLSQDNDRFSPLVVEVEGQFAIIAFHSPTAADQFVAQYQVRDLTNNLAKTRTFDVPCLLSARFRNCGLLLEPQSDQAILLPGRLLEMLEKFLMQRSDRQEFLNDSQQQTLNQTVEFQVPGSAAELTVRDIGELSGSLDQTVTEFSTADQTVEELPELIQAIGTLDPLDELTVMRNENLVLLEHLGLELSDSAPNLPTDLRLRSIEEIAARLLGLGAVFSWVSASESLIPRTAILRAIKSRDLERFVSREEREVLAVSRSEASQNFSRTIGWKLEYAWPLAWVLGFETEPTVDVKHIDALTSRQIIQQFLQNMQHNVESLTDRSVLRSNDQVVRIYDLLLCAQHAIKLNGWASGGNLTPEQRLRQAKVVYQRRMALLWCLTPGLAWDELASKRFIDSQTEA